MQLKGSCQCDAILFEVETPTKWCAHCHCGKCQRAHGAAFVTWFGVQKEQFRITKGEELLKWFASSKNAERGFCRRCGSTLFFKSTRWKDEIHLVLANMNSAIDRQPAAHVFFDSQANWFTVKDSLSKYGGESGTEPLPD